jgi:hypothetical protein
MGIGGKADKIRPRQGKWGFRRINWEGGKKGMVVGEPSSLHPCWHTSERKRRTWAGDDTSEEIHVINLENYLQRREREGEREGEKGVLQRETEWEGVECKRER